ncbi:MAG: ImmA/IrrE family metallo-endopeptidase [Clostridia bacterium]|nr:ImmA/IrrE family metallo-endopeptidase [Clostridia bacterium]
MRLEYPMYPNGMYCLGNDDFDTIASMVLGEYLPEALKKPQPVDIDYLIEECFYLEVKKAHITLDGHILGMMVFEDTKWEYYDRLYRPVVEELKESTMMIDLSLSGDKNLPRERFTKAHEMSHWICHRSLHSYDKLPYEFRRSPAIACRGTNIERYRYGEEFQRSESDWEEWQADRLAAALLMPKEPFIYISRAVIDNCGIGNSVLVKGYYTEASKRVISIISKFFMVSRKAAQIRMSQLGLLIG